MVHAVKLAVVDGNLGIARILPLPAAVLIVPEAPIDHVIHTRVAHPLGPAMLGHLQLHYIHALHQFLKQELALTQTAAAL